MTSRAKTGNARGVPISEALCAALKWASQLETTDVTQAGSGAPGLLLSRISISLAAQSMGSMGALKGKRVLNMNRKN
jgi:hypothetical protein